MSGRWRRPSSGSPAIWTDGARLPRPLTADELAEVDTAVVAGLQPASTRPGLDRLKHIDGYATSFWVSPWDITSETLDQLWLADTDATVVRSDSPPSPAGPGCRLGCVITAGSGWVKCVGRAESAHRPPVGRGAGESAGPGDAPTAGGAGAGATRRRTARSAGGSSRGGRGTATLDAPGRRER